MPKFFTPIDLSKQEIRNAVFHKLSNAPASPAAGQFYYDTDDNTPYCWNGTTWVAMSAAGGSAPTGPAGGDLSGSYPNPDIAAGAIVNADINASAAIALSKLATDPLARANHTGTQTASTISNFDTQVRTSTLAQMAAPTGAVSMNSQNITNLATPSNATDAANKSYVDGVAAGLSFKRPVRVASTTNGTLASAYQNGSTVDGQTLATGDEIALFGQTTASENGLYTVNATGAPTRRNDADASGEIVAGTIVYVRQGTANGAQQWVCTATGATPWVPGSSTSAWALYFAATAVQAGAGLTVSGNVLAVGAGTGISVGADTVGIDTAVVARKATFNVGNNSNTDIVLTHNLGTRDVTVKVYTNGSPYDEVFADVEHTDTNTVTVKFATAPTTNQFRAIVVG